VERKNEKILSTINYYKSNKTRTTEEGSLPSLPTLGDSSSPHQNQDFLGEAAR
jgi:hypothetical protein